jgi:dTMP kinase
VSKRGKFIVFEGLDGSGKTTQANNLVKRLNSLGIKSVYTKEPTESIPGGVARSAIYKKTSLQMESMALLFLADRVEHVTGDILPALEQGRTIICDRYYLSNIAYQGLEMDKDALLSFNRMILKEKLVPDVTIFLDVSPEICCERISRNRLRTDLYEEVNKQVAIRNNFFETFEKVKDSENILIIESNDDPDYTFERIWLKISRMFTNEAGDIDFAN